MKQEYAKAQSFLAIKFYKGEDVPKNYVRANAWCSVMAARGDAIGKKVRKLIAGLMTPAHIAEAQKLPREYWEKYVVPFRKE